MKYGYFDDTSKEYVISSPMTPLPWINYLGCEDFFSIVSNTCGGYSFYKDAKLLRLTRYRYNNVPTDSNGHYYYINDDGDIWNPGWQPTQAKLEEYECRHGLGYSRFHGSRGNLTCDVTKFVPLAANCEVNIVKLKNNSLKAKHFSLYSFVEFCLWNAMDDMTNYQRNLNTGEVEVDGSTIYHKTEYRERRNHYSLYSVNADIDGFDTDRESFIGAYGDNSCPKVVKTNISSNSIASGGSPIASHHIKIDLAPGEEHSLVFVLAYIENEDKNKWQSLGIINKKSAQELLTRFSTVDKAEAALNSLKVYWSSLLSNYMVTLEDKKVSRMVNIWNQYQCMVTFNMSRSASYYESGTGRGMGFRDSCQDLLGFVHIIPERARQRIIDIASTQFEDGSAYHQYQPLTKKGNLDIGSGFNDDPLWLIAGVSAYLRETGDFALLDEQIPYDNDTSKSTSLLEHLRRSFSYTTNNIGPHGLPLIGRADWNDCLNLNCFSTIPGESFQTCANFESGKAESILIAGMYVKYGKEYADICRHQNLQDEAAEISNRIDDMTATVLKNGWDGSWFIRAYDAFEHKIGSHECQEGQIYIEPQGLCVMGGIGIEDGKALEALNSVKDKLDTKYGIVLLQPAYTTYHTELGEISSYPPGYKENAGIFCHSNPWIAIAETMIGRGNRAFDIYKKICPAYTEAISNIHKAEPYCYAQMIAGKDAVRFGEAKNSWLTGTAAWNFVAISQNILGIIPGLLGLTIDPCIPSDWKSYDVVRKFRGHTYNIHVDNNHHVEKGIKKILVNGKIISGNVIPISKNDICNVIVTMG